MLLWIFLISFSFASPSAHYLQWFQKKHILTEHPEPQYRFASEIHQEIVPLIREKPGVIEAFRVGLTVKKRPIWGFRLRAPSRDIRVRVLVFAALHPLEWVGAEVAIELIKEL